MVSKINFIFTPQSKNKGIINITKDNILVAKFPIIGNSISHMKYLTKQFEKTHYNILLQLTSR